MDTSENDLGELIQAIEIYNRQFGVENLGELLAEKVETGKTKEVAYIEIGTQISWGNIELRYKDLLAATGLSLEAIDANATVFTGGDQIPSTQMRINIANGKAFVQYLDSLTQETITDTQKYGLQEVAKSITLQLSKEYSLDDPEDERVLDLFGQLEPVINSYGKLGLGKSTEKLSEYLDFARKGFLLEYIKIQREDLFAEVGGHNFGPSEWHTDMSPEHYQERWEQALNTLDGVSQNPRAEELAQKLKTHLKQSAEYAQQDIVNNPAFTEYYSKPQRQALKETLKYVVQHLS